MEAPRPDTVTGPERRRFYAALALFLVWVAALGAMAALSGRRPAAHAAAVEGR